MPAGSDMGMLVGMKIWHVMVVAVLGAGSVLAETRATAELVPYTAKTMEEAVVELRARGYPATMEDLQRRGVADEVNSAWMLRTAAERIVPEKSGPRSSAFEYGPWLPYPEKWFELADEMMEAHDGALMHVRQARKLNNVAWAWGRAEEPWGEQMTEVIKGLGPLRALASVVGDAALWAHFRGDEAEAFERMRDLRFMAEAVGQRPFLVSKLVALGVRGVAGSNYHLIGMGLKVADGKGEGGVEREKVIEAIGWLLDEEGLRRMYMRGILEDRVYAMADEEVRESWGEEVGQSLAAYEQMADMLKLPAWADEEAADKAAAGEATGSMAGALLDTTRRLRQLMARQILSERAAAVSLAMGLYRHDHGRYPESLAALVPDYLPAVPVDLYSRTGAAMGYALLEEGRRPRVGSVGPDGVDAGTPEMMQADPHYFHFRDRIGEADDAWVDVSAWRPEER